jgi:hypothetical protein
LLIGYRGLYHFGHVLGLLESGVLPNIISGTSGGSVVGAIICTRTDVELKHDLNPLILIKYLKCFQRPWKERIKSVIRTGNLFCFDEWMELIQWYVVCVVISYQMKTYGVSLNTYHLKWFLCFGICQQVYMWSNDI